MHNIDTFKNYCMMDIQDFWNLDGGVVYEEGGQRYWYQNNKSRILAIAHLDTVQKTKHFGIVKNIAGNDWVFAPTLDNRAGVYIIMHLLKSLGLTYDILLTEDEEIGKSTASLFKTKKKYLWMFSFDRRDEDVVLYRYDHVSITDKLKEVGFKIGHGSNSDINYLESLGCKGFNVGNGVQSEHDLWSRLNMSVMDRQVARFVEFFNKNKSTHFPHEAYVPKVETWSPCKGCGTTIIAEYLDKDGLCYQCRTRTEITWVVCKYCTRSISLKHNPNRVCGVCEAKMTKCVDCGGIVEPTAVYNNLCISCHADRLTEDEEMEEQQEYRWWEMCDVCGIKLGKDDLWETGMCRKCQQTHRECVILPCKSIEKRDTMYKGMCKMHATLVQSGVTNWKWRTTVKCTVCSLTMTAKELHESKDKVCPTCKKKT